MTLTIAILMAMAAVAVACYEAGRAGGDWDAHVESALEQARDRHPSALPPLTPPGAAAAPTPPLGNDRGAGRTS